jgi:hypothetical protein
MSCPALLFAYFYTASSSDQALHYAVSRDGSHWSTLNGGFPVLNTSTVGGLRDPFLNRGPDNRFHMVATNGANFGGDSSILAWSSTDLITWAAESVVNVMGPSFFPKGQIGDVWAPEWHADPAGGYMVFWAARGDGIMPSLPSPGCAGNQSSRFAFFATHTDDFTFAGMTQPTVIFDPGCDATGDGGIDGDIVLDEDGVYTLVYKDARGVGEGHNVEMYRGIRIATSSTSSLGRRARRVVPRL